MNDYRNRPAVDAVRQISIPVREFLLIATAAIVAVVSTLGVVIACGGAA